MDQIAQAEVAGETTDCAPKRLSVLGATGSIGDSTMDIVRRNPDRFEIEALVAGQNVGKVAKLAREVGAKFVAVADAARSDELKDALAGSGIRSGAGEAAVLEAAQMPADIVVGAIVGAAGIRPTYAALEANGTIALANKECLVSAGDLFTSRAKSLNGRILPLDSEHNAIFQVLEMRNRREISKIIVTASGGPFRTASREQMAVATVQQALNHPNWSMGSRVTIDSATMMNKGFEVIEAYHLFPVEKDQIDVLVHAQSAVHGLVQYADGALLAQLGAPDMRTPIAHCLAWPKRLELPVEHLDLAALGSLTFEKPDLERFPALRVALEALREGGLATAALNAADEVAVAAFLQEKIGYLDIAALVEDVIAHLSGKGQLKAAESIDEVLAFDAEVRVKAEEVVLRLAH